MNIPLTVPYARRVILGLALCSAGLLSSPSWAQPSGRPLLSNQSGAKPNLMVALDNSGSMAYPFHEAYGILLATDAATALRRCAPPLYSNSPTGFLLGGTVDPAQPDGQKCLSAVAFDVNGNPTSYNYSANNGVAYTTAINARYSMLAQRSADLNPVYYNPRTTYSPRLGPDYQPLVRPANPQFISNVGSSTTTASFYTVYRNNPGSALYTVNVQKPAPIPVPAWATAANSVYSLRGFRFPVHVEYSTPGSAATPAFTYTYCRTTAGVSTVQKTPDGMEVGCTSVRRTPLATSADGSFVSVFAPGHPSAAGNVIALPADHTRTDCAAVNSCTNGEELINVLNWYHWYSTRQLATSTAIGQSLAADKFQDKLRIGYLPINDYTLANGPAGGNTNLSIVRNPAVAAPGTGTGDATVLRGVRELNPSLPTDPAAANTQLYSFLNNVQSRGGTPLHNAVTKVAEYYGVPNGAVENPWSSNPAALASPATPVSPGNPEMSCRRSFNLLFSDGGWSPPPTAPSPAGPDFNNTNGPVFSRTLADGTTDTFQYLPTGVNTVTGRLQYTPYPDSPASARGGLADVTANYFWHTDLRTALANNVQTRPGQPTFWQNMTTYTVGYQIKPTGAVTGTGLTFAQLDQYQTQYANSGYAAATKPSWPTGNLLASQNQTRVDDFIHAGYTGGGRSFSATTSDDVRRIFDTILSEILSASGRDAGVSVSSGGDSSNLAGQFKYTVSYRTLDNSGNILARQLDADGEETGVTLWSAELLMPAPASRRVFTMHDTDQPINFSGNFTGLPSDVRDELRQGPDAARVPNDASFINYLRGDNSPTDTAGRLFRQRASKIASMVNPPSVLMNYARDYNYDLITAGGVDGWDSYKAFAGRKAGYPSSLFVSTNAGVMHSFNATTGVEQAAFMPRRSLSRMLAFAREPYSFEYVLDGPLSQNDVFDRRFAVNNSLAIADQWRAWRHMAVGSGGRGEQLIYAVNSPFKPGTPPTRIPDREDFLWETGPDIVNAADGNDLTLGYIANPARSGQTEDSSDITNSQRGRWIVAVNNGHYNGEPNGEKAGLVVLDALTGAVIRTIPLPSGYSAGRGLSGVTLLRNYGLHDRVVAAYAGDGNGQMWRFNLTGDPSTWHVEHNRPLFTVPGNRPIFGAPAWQPHSEGGFIVVFATGMMLEESDLDDLGDQAIYGIWDRMDVNGVMVGAPFAEVTFAQLQQQNVLPATATDRNNVTFYGITNNEIDWGAQHGWYMPLVNVHQTDPALSAGERSIAEVQNIGTSVQITTTVLRRAANTEMCAVSDLPANYLYLLNAQTASAARSRSFDVIGPDPRLDAFAVAYLPRGGFSRGVSVAKYYSRADGTPLSTNPLPTPLNPSDPNVDLGPDARPMGVGADGEFEAASEDSPTKCRNMRSTHMGTESNALQGGVACPTTGWSRTQFQLSAPPANN